MAIAVSPANYCWYWVNETVRGLHWCGGGGGQYGEVQAHRYHNKYTSRNISITPNFKLKLAKLSASFH